MSVIDGPEQTFSIVGKQSSPTMRWFSDGIAEEMRQHGHRYEPQTSDARLILNFVEPDAPHAYRRQSQATFVTSITELPEKPEDILRAGYPYLVRTLSNLMILIVPNEDEVEAHFVTLEQGHYVLRGDRHHRQQFFDEIYSRLQPLASSQLVINNVFNTDLEPELWQGDEITEQITRAGQMLDGMNLLPAPFPIDDLLSPRELRQVHRLFGIGGLSYGNLSARKDPDRFWMSASGVNKGKLHTVGQDILMVTGYDAVADAMVLSVPPDVKPRRVSVDAVEHWMIYREHPGVGAIVHLHAWMDGIPSTDMNYPCGTLQIAEAVAELIRQEPDPSHAVVGLRNHGITVTGPSMDNVLERIEDQIIPQVPMT